MAAIQLLGFLLAALPLCHSFSTSVSHRIRPLPISHTRTTPRIRTSPLRCGLQAPVLSPGTGPDNWFDDAAVGSPVVRRYSNEMEGDTWTMWFSGRSADFDEKVLPLSTGRIGMAGSRDGLSWERVAGPDEKGACLGLNPDWWCFDTAHLGLGDCNMFSSAAVRTEGSAYWMYYFGGDTEEVQLGGKDVSGTKMSIGVALSLDGLNWARIEGEHANGAVLVAGDDGDWDSAFVGWPSVVQTPQTKQYIMHYHSRHQDRFVIGVATSANGINWRKLGPVVEPGAEGEFDAGGCSSRCVIWESATEQYIMLYEALDQQGLHSIGLATSPDGLAWTKASQGPVFKPSDQPSAWDSGAVGRPYVVPMEDGSFRMYYYGQAPGGANPTSSGIGLAVSQGSDFSKWTRYDAGEAGEDVLPPPPTAAPDVAGQ